MTNDNTLIPVDFEDLTDWLDSIESDFSASELHGALVGGLSGTMRLSPQEWSAFGLAVMGADERIIGEDGNRKLLSGLAQEQLDLLSDDELKFMPFLPEDDVDLTARVEGMALWCKGFLGGFAEAQAYQSQLSESGATLENLLDELPPNVTEALQDMTAIAQATIETIFTDEGEDEEYLLDDSEQEAERPDNVVQYINPTQNEEREYEYSEYDEKDYVELVEYLRLAALTVFTEYGWVEAHSQADAERIKQSMDLPGSAPSPGKPTLH